MGNKTFNGRQIKNLKRWLSHLFSFTKKYIYDITKESKRRLKNEKNKKLGSNNRR